VLGECDEKGTVLLDRASGEGVVGCAPQRLIWMIYGHGQALPPHPVPLLAGDQRMLHFEKKME
jgi:hypothetical protein